MTRKDAALRAVDDAYRLRSMDPNAAMSNMDVRQMAIDKLHHKLSCPPLEATALVDEVLRDIILE